jgi:hypothetical protein
MVLEGGWSEFRSPFLLGTLFSQQIFSGEVVLAQNLIFIKA